VILTKKRRVHVPTYEYECQRTGKRFERFQRITARPLRKCPECGGPVRRLIGTGAAIISKGSGFYATDYGGGSRSGPSCDRSRPCCGRDVPCDAPPCDE